MAGHTEYLKKGHIYIYIYIYIVNNDNLIQTITITIYILYQTFQKGLTLLMSHVLNVLLHIFDISGHYCVLFVEYLPEDGQKGRNM